GVQTIAPAGDTVNPVGPLTKAKTRVCTGRSASVAAALALKATSSLMVASSGTVSTGATFSSLTVRVKLLVTLRFGVLLSVTLMATTLTPGPWASVGVQAIAPDGETVNPLGPLTRAKVRFCAGRSASVAVALALKANDSLIVALAGTVSTGAWFASLTVNVKL